VAGLFEYSYERSSIFNVQQPYDITDEGEKFIGSIIPGIIFDSRNDKFNAAEGFFSSSHFEWAAHSFGSKRDIGYYRFTSNNSGYLPLFENIGFAGAVNFGFERSNLAGKEIPILKLFRMGGVGSIRGYKEDGIEVETKRNISGSLTSLNYRGEVRFPFMGSFGGALFYDAGNLFVDRIAAFKVRSSAGINLRYATPVGPVALDFAKKLQSDSVIGDTAVTDDPDRFRVHFAIGVF
jgi:translocation and assembly module TamA